MLISLYSTSVAQVYMLTLEESIEIAKQKSHNMRALRQDLIIAENNLAATTSNQKTNINLNFTLPNYASAVKEKMDSAGVYFSARTLNYSGYLTISQPLPTDGRIAVVSSLSTLRDFEKDFRSAKFSTRIELVQPIDALYGNNATKLALKRAQLDYEQSNKALRREELNLVYQVSRSYYSLLSLQKQAEYAHMDLIRQTEAYDISKKKYEAGLIREVEALQNEVELAVAQSKYDIAILDNNEASNSFKQVLGINLEDSVILSSDLQYRIVSVDHEKAVALALENRLEIREQDIQIELQKLNIRQQKALGMVRGNVNAYYEKVGVSNSSDNFNIPYAFDNSFGDYRVRPSNFGVLLSITIPIFDWGRNKSLVRMAEARLKRNFIQKDQLEVNIKAEVLNLVDNINTNLKRLQLLEKNLVVAQKSFEITLERYNDGDIDSQYLAQERNRLNNSYTSHLGAYISYQLSLADIMRKTFYDFVNNKAIK